MPCGMRNVEKEGERERRRRKEVCCLSSQLCIWNCVGRENKTVTDHWRCVDN